MPMNPRLLRPIASGVHPEANAWRSAVVANGGSVSASTMRAVSKFCADVDINGLRSKLVRVNLMCGNNLNSVLVPLYRATSPTGTPLGNATDTNDNFTNDHYSENSGLVGNASNRRLNTGLNRSALGQLVHGGCFVFARSTGAFRAYFGVENQATAFDRFFLDTGNPATDVRFANNGPAATGQTAGAAHAAKDFIIGSVTALSANSARLHINGSFVVAASGVDATTITHPIQLFAMFRGSDSSFTAHSDGRIGGYTFGESLSDAEVTTYSTIWDTFLKALGRR